MNTAYLQCTLCGEHYAPDVTRYVCPKHGDAGVLDVVYDFEKIKSLTSPGVISASSDYSIWRYWDLLPIQTRAAIPPLQVGWTPLYHEQKWGESLGLPNLYLKDDGRNPTASFKDRAGALVVAKAHELGVEVITTASSGNAGAALAGLAASAQMRAVVFVPETAPPAKVAQLLIFGACVLLVKGTYDEAFDLCLAASKEFGWYCRNTAYNPYTTEGKKTAALEICEQLGWRAPDRIFVSVGDGNILSGIWKGLCDLRALGWIPKMPKLMGVQAEGAAACYNAWRTGYDDLVPVDAHTLADSIRVGLPRDGKRALRAVRETNGAFITVSDEEILSAMREMARGAGVFAEPAGVAGYAGLVKVVNESKTHAKARSLDHNSLRLDQDETIVVVVTGNGLKDIPSAVRAAGSARVIEPKLEQVRRAIKGLELGDESNG